MTGALGSIIGGVFGNDGNQKSNYQPSGGYGNYQPSGGYSSQQSNSGSDLLSGIGSAIGSSLFNSALGGLKKHGKDVSIKCFNYKYKNFLIYLYNYFYRNLSKIIIRLLHQLIHQIL